MHSKRTFDLSCGHDVRLRFGLRRQAAWRAEVERRRQRDAAFCYLCSDCTGSSLELGNWLLELYRHALATLLASAKTFYFNDSVST